ncbi:MAG TPA: hypothetical protein VHL57_03845 [Flavobacteriales bacterium]|jgi:hypothetical protein|nr:hypothetical protein [Flavobacteriales bacterium]
MTTERKTAGHLTVADIGLFGRWEERDESRQIFTVITAEIRQISHNGNETAITYGYGAERETVLAHDHPICVGNSPVHDYSDYKKWETAPF